MKLTSFCVVWGLGNKSYVKAIGKDEAIAKVQADINALCPHANLQITDCYAV